MRKPKSKPSARIAERKAQADHQARERACPTGISLDEHKAGMISLRALFSASHPNDPSKPAGCGYFARINGAWAEAKGTVFERVNLLSAGLHGEGVRDDC